MSTKNPTFNLKTGADSDLIVSREFTENNASLGKIKRKDGIFKFPYLTRRTGDTLSGTTENIESNELKHGRTKSAPRKGNSSSSGDINFEFSPETFDDMLEAVLRGKWKRWTSDTNSPSNKDKNAYQDGYFATKCASGNSGKKLVYDGTGSGDSEGLVHVANNGQGFVIHELNSETNDVKYSLLRKYGGQTGEDLWQEFTHCALNTMQLSVEINSIVTGSFGIMGTNNPKLLDTDELALELENRLADVEDADSLKDKGNWTAGASYVKNDIVYVESEKLYYRCESEHVADTDWTVDKAAGKWTKIEAHEFLGSIPDKATDTMQFTARDGFLYINGKQIEFAQSLSFSLDNGLSQKFAIFVHDAISSTPLTLDITGDLSTYLVGGKSEAKELFNNAVGDKTVEILFCFQDKADDPTALYVFQIFNAKHTENTVNGNGEDTYDESLPWSSFNEQACRVFRIMLPRVTDIEAQEVVGGGAATGNPNLIAMIPNVELSDTDSLSDMVITSTLDGVDNTSAMSFENPEFVSDETDDNFGFITAKFTAVTQTASEQVLGITVKWKGNEFTKSFRIPSL